MGTVTTRDMDFLGNVYTIESDEAATSIFECGDALFAVSGTDWTDDHVKELIKVYRRGVRVGEDSGKESARAEIRRALGAAGIGS